jgi:hypothetical protein
VSQLLITNSEGKICLQERIFSLSDNLPKAMYPHRRAAQVSGVVTAFKIHFEIDRLVFTRLAQHNEQCGMSSTSLLQVIRGNYLVAAVSPRLASLVPRNGRKFAEADRLRDSVPRRPSEPDRTRRYG